MLMEVQIVEKHIFKNKNPFLYLKMSAYLKQTDRLTTS